VKGPLMVPAIGIAAFFLLLNTSPSTLAVINSVGAHIRATAISQSIFSPSTFSATFHPRP
jgi:hypothetical protein